MAIVNPKRGGTTPGAARWWSARSHRGGVEAADGSRIEAGEKIGGGPSVLYDAVAVLPSEEGANLLLSNGSAKDFVSDAFAHLKFIAYVNAALPLFEKAGIPGSLDEGSIGLSGPKGSRSLSQPAGNSGFGSENRL